MGRTYAQRLFRQINIRNLDEFTAEHGDHTVVHDSVGDTGKGLHEISQAASGEDLGLKIVVTLILAASTMLGARPWTKMMDMAFNALQLGKDSETSSEREEWDSKNVPVSPFKTVAKFLGMDRRGGYRRTSTFTPHPSSSSPCASVLLHQRQDMWMSLKRTRRW
jgi:hypothetical protein